MIAIVDQKKFDASAIWCIALSYVPAGVTCDVLVGQQLYSYVSSLRNLIDPEVFRTVSLLSRMHARNKCMREIK